MNVDKPCLQSAMLPNKVHCALVLDGNGYNG